MAEKKSRTESDEEKGQGFRFAVVDREVLLDRRLSAYDKAVYAILCLHAAWRTGKCYPGASRIAEILDISERQVRYSIAALVENRVILKARRMDEKKGGRQTSNMYTVCAIARNASRSPVAGNTAEHEEGGTACSSPMHDLPVPPAQRAPKRNQENETKRTIAGGAERAPAVVALQVAGEEPDDYAVSKTPSGRKPADPPEMQQLFEAALDILDVREGEMSASELGKWKRGIKELLAAGVTPDEFPDLVDRHLEFYPRIAVTSPNVLANKLGALRSGQSAPAGLKRRQATCGQPPLEFVN